MISKTECLELLHEKFNLQQIEEYEKKLKKDFGTAYTEYTKELSRIIKEYGLGEDIKIKIYHDIYDPEIMFKVKSPYEMSSKKKGEFINKIQCHMLDFSRKNGLYEFFMNAYILVE